MAFMRVWMIGLHSLRRSFIDVFFAKVPFEVENRKYFVEKERSLILFAVSSSMVDCLTGEGSGSLTPPLLQIDWQCMFCSLV